MKIMSDEEDEQQENDAQESPSSQNQTRTADITKMGGLTKNKDKVQ